MGRAENLIGFENVYKINNANKVAKEVKYLFRKLSLHVLVNKAFSYLDDKDFNTINTMNYVVVARKI